jgi:hypothetical protein
MRQTMLRAKTGQCSRDLSDGRDNGWEIGVREHIAQRLRYRHYQPRLVALSRNIRYVVIKDRQDAWVVSESPKRLDLSDEPLVWLPAYVPSVDLPLALR